MSLPEDPERLIAAVILDGPGWARRHTVGDRDGLPQQVLGQMLRWPSVERVWLPAWLQDSEGVVIHLEQRIRDVAAAHGLSVTPERLPTAPVEDLAAQAAIPPAETDRIDDEWEDLLSDEPESLTTAQLRRSAESSPPDEFVALPGESVFEPWVPVTYGPRSVLDGLPTSSPAQTVRNVLLNAVAIEGPVHDARLAKLVAESFDLARVSADRAKAILKCLPPRIAVCRGVCLRLAGRRAD